MPLFRPRPPFTAAALLLAAVGALFTALTVLMTWPQAREFATHAADHQDVYFNMWRLGWFAHALASPPSTLFDGNIFYPEPKHAGALRRDGGRRPDRLAAAVGRRAPGARSQPAAARRDRRVGVGMFVLVDRLTGSRAAGVLAGIIFAFAPYRFEHYMHMELQWTMWMPLAFWALHRTIDSRPLAARIC